MVNPSLPPLHVNGDDVTQKNSLERFFIDNPSVAVAFSGGVDSSYLLYAALHYGAKVKAYYVKTEFQPDFEYRDALQMAENIGADIKVIDTTVLGNQSVISNPENRCYFCKRAIFEKLTKQAWADGFQLIIDGTNASDDASDRPGMKALEELSIRSPLRECGISKDEIRNLSKQVGLFTWDKPAYACLATRIPTGMTITAEILRSVEKSEEVLFSLGFTDFRVRVMDKAAKIQLPEDQMYKAIEKKTEIINNIKQYFPNVLLDLEGRR